MALAIDLVLLAALYIFLFSLFAGLLLNAVMRFELSAILTLFSSYLIVFPIFFVLFHMFYFTLFHALSGQTIGKMIMGIRVVTSDNKELTPAVAFLRWTGYIVSFIPLASGFLWSAVDKDHCAWHDRLAETRVISAEMT
ncbi:MAG: hypothetical protein AMJ61_08930 [Desulfobacterales bacterium SG8_35_2]|nr:MAG: hypothetical protein AMJ61_08930 [Desulfobacterales bacterium SG8_35_2]